MAIFVEEINLPIYYIVVHLPINQTVAGFMINSDAEDFISAMDDPEHYEVRKVES